MNNQLQQLEDSVNRLAAQFNAATIENRQLARKITLLQQQKQQQLADSQARQQELIKKYELRLLQIQESLQHQVSELSAEKQYYQQILDATSEEIQRLLQRLPAARQEG
ncbi:hypothetical protein PT286_01565 [Neisseriaceae bacterium ESL0693]|nr:hypothetical protein [Neisseriaceae bacterium ESL0693]